MRELIGSSRACGECSHCGSSITKKVEVISRAGHGVLLSEAALRLVVERTWRRTTVGSRRQSLLRSRTRKGTSKAKMPPKYASFGRVACIAALTVIPLFAGAAQTVVRVPQLEIDAVTARYQAFGVTVPKDGLVLPEPFQPPYSNRSFIVPSSWFFELPNAYHADPATTVSADDFRADLPTLRLMIENVYAGYDTAVANGWDWDGWLRGWDQDLERHHGTRLTLPVALAPWLRFEEFQPDSHAGPMIPRLFDIGTASVSAQLDTEAQGICSQMRAADGRVRQLTADPGQQPHAVVAWNGKALSPAWYISYPSAWGGTASLVCGGRVITTTMTAQAKHGSPGPAYENLGDGIAYLRVPWIFNYANDKALREVLAKQSGLGHERVLILDIRGNGGGAAPWDVLHHCSRKPRLMITVQRRRDTRRNRASVRGCSSTWRSTTATR